MASDSDVRNQPIEIDPNFFLPPSVVDARYEDTTIKKPKWDTGGEGDGTGMVDIIQMPEDPEVSPLPSGTGPVAIPSDINVVSQTVRMGEDGSWFVDVVLEVFPEDGAVSHYEARVMPA